MAMLNAARALSALSLSGQMGFGGKAVLLKLLQMKVLF